MHRSISRSRLVAHLLAARTGLCGSFGRLMSAAAAAMLALAAGCAGVTPPAQEPPAPAEGKILLRARVCVLSGLHERGDFAATLPLDLRRVTDALPGKSLPEPLSAWAFDVERQTAVPCGVSVRTQDEKGKPVAEPSVSIRFLVAGPLPVMGNREFEVAIGQDLPSAGELKAPPPFLSIVQVETRLLSLDMTDGTNLFRLAEATAPGNLVLNGGFECDTWQAGSAGPGWTLRPFYYSAPGRAVRADATPGDPRAGKALHVLHGGLVSAPFEVEPGRRYRLRFRARAGDTPNPRGLNAILKLVGPNGADDHAELQHLNWPDVFVTPEWRSFERVLPTPFGPKWGYLVFKADSASDFWVDEVAVEKVERLAPVARFDTAEALMPRRSDREEGGHAGVAWDPAENALTLAPRENLIADGSFERDGTWTLTATPPLAQPSAAARRDGARALSFQPPAARTAPAPVSAVSQKFTLDPTQPYALSFLYRLTIASSPVRVRVETEDGALLLDDLLASWAQFSAERGDGWMRRTAVIPAGLLPPGSGPCGATLSFLAAPKKHGPAYIDAVCLVAGAQPAPFGEKHTHAGEGFAISEITDLGQGGARIAWGADTPEGTSLEFWARTGPTPSFEEKSWSAWRPVENGGRLAPTGRGLDNFAQWKATLKTARADATPRVRWVEIRRDPPSGPLRSPAIRIAALRNGEITPAALDWLKTLEKEEPLDEWLKHPGFHEMVRTAQRVIAPYHDDLDRQDAIMTWFKNNAAVNYGSTPDTRHPPVDKTRQPRKGWPPEQYFRWFENGTRGDGWLICSHFGIIHTAFCRAAGIPARMMSLGSFAGSGHNMSEVWSEQYQKWYFADAEYGGLLTLDGVPQSLVEMQDLYYRDEYHRLRVRIGGARRDPQMPLERAWGALDDSRRYGRLNLSPLVDWLGIHSLGWDEDRLDLYRWYIPPHAPFMNIPYYLEPNPKAYTGGALKGREELDFKLNQVEMAFDLAGGDAVAVRLRHSGMDFDHYEIVANGVRTEWKGESYRWPLNPGANRIAVRTVSRLGHQGKAFTADLWREPGR